MKTETTREVISVSMEMDLQEALRFLKDPSAAQSHVAGVLAAAGVQVEDVAGRKKRVPRVLKCDRCGKECDTEHGLNIHTARMHPETLKGGK